VVVIERYGLVLDDDDAEEITDEEWIESIFGDG
jgi:hypothetical protein